MVSDKRKMLTIKVSYDLYNALNSAIVEGRYSNMTVAVTEALEKELQQPSRQNLDSVVQELRHELDVAKTAYTGIQRLIEEKDKRIDDLIREVETLNVFAHYFKATDVKQLDSPETIKVKPWWKFW
jgi:Arc/MetJ-type ribon-helix-helix transcriptional regulator